VSDSSASVTEAPSRFKGLIRGFHGVRYQVKDVAGLHFRNEMEVGPGGKQIQLLDPDGNPIELFEPAR